MRKIHCNVIACADLQFQVFLLVHTEWYCTLALLEKTKKKRQKIVINVLMFLNLFLKYTQVTFKWCTCNISTAHRKGDLANIVRKGVRMLSAICHIGVPSQAITRNQQKKKKKKKLQHPSYPGIALQTVWLKGNPLYKKNYFKKLS